jgi:phage terminase large subunit-like protein
VRAFTPADTMKDRGHRDRAPYVVWAEQGVLTATPGTEIKQRAVRDCLNEFRTLFQVDRVGYDKWNAGGLVEDLKTEEGGAWPEEQLIEVPQVFQHMSIPSKDFEAEVLGGRANANGNPLMALCVSNTVVQRDGKDNIQPIKKRSRGRIDPVVAAIIARKLADRGEVGGSVYDTPQQLWV